MPNYDLGTKRKKISPYLLIAAIAVLLVLIACLLGLLGRLRPAGRSLRRCLLRLLPFGCRRSAPLLPIRLREKHGRSRNDYPYDRGGIHPCQFNLRLMVSIPLIFRILSMTALRLSASLT